MSEFTFHFHGNDSFVSRLIQWRTHSNFSHVSVQHRSMYYQAYFTTKFHRTDRIPTDILDSITLSVNNPQVEREILDYLNAHLGTPYDRKSILGWIAGVYRQNEKHLYCSEMAINVLNRIARCPRNKAPQMVSPDGVHYAVYYYLQGLKG